MSPALIKGDTVTVSSGARAEIGHMVAILVTDEEMRTTKLCIRKVIREGGHVIFKAINSDYPSFILDEQSRNNIRVVGIVTKQHRYFGIYDRPGRIVTAKLAQRNRIALEMQSDHITLDETEEI